MKNILVPCDFSKPAVEAFRFALELAAVSHGKIHLLNVMELPIVHNPLHQVVSPFVFDWGDKVSEELKKISSTYKTGVDVIPVVEFGAPVHGITSYAKKHSIDLIVMGSHGASGLREVLVGSTAEKVVRYSSAPVLITKEYFKGTVRNIVFPNTLETESQEELTLKLKALQDFFKATVHIVFINTPTNFTSDNVTLPRLQEFAKHFMFKNYTINVYNAQFEEDGIINFTRSIGGDLIAMGTHARKGIPHMINGSVAEDVANHTDALIWTYASK